MTQVEAELSLLSLANEKDKFAIQLGVVLEPAVQQALERGIDQDWFTLVDISTIAEYPGIYFRLFRLTDKGHYRRAVLRGERLQ